jgi:hypothetical protein
MAVITLMAYKNPANCVVQVAKLQEYPPHSGAAKDSVYRIVAKVSFSAIKLLLDTGGKEPS